MSEEIRRQIVLVKTGPCVTADLGVDERRIEGRKVADGVTLYIAAASSEIDVRCPAIENDRLTGRLACSPSPSASAGSTGCCTSPASFGGASLLTARRAPWHHLHACRRQPHTRHAGRVQAAFGGIG